MPGKEMEKVTLAGEKCDFLRVKKKGTQFCIAKYKPSNKLNSFFLVLET